MLILRSNIFLALQHACVNENVKRLTVIICSPYERTYERMIVWMYFIEHDKIIDFHLRIAKEIIKKTQTCEFLCYGTNRWWCYYFCAPTWSLYRIKKKTMDGATKNSQHDDYNTMRQDAIKLRRRYVCVCWLVCVPSLVLRDDYAY